MRLRYRPFQAVAIATLAALVTACAAFAPLYGRAMQQALTDLAVDRTEQEVVGLQLRAIASDPRTTFGSHVRTRPPAPETVLARVPAGMRRSYLAPVLGYAAVATVPRGEIPATDPGSRTASTGELRWREHACDHLTFSAGGCPARPGDVAISEADARILGMRVGMSFGSRASRATTRRRSSPPPRSRSAGCTGSVRATSGSASTSPGVPGSSTR